jgi:hypothetical protein
VRLTPRARFELATLRLTAEEVRNLSAVPGVAYRRWGAILASLVAPNAAPKPGLNEATQRGGPNETCEVLKKRSRRNMESFAQFLDVHFIEGPLFVQDFGYDALGAKNWY